MSETTGGAPDIDPIILQQFLADGLGWIVADELDADRLNLHDYVGLLHADGMPLLLKDIKARERLVVLMRPGEEGAAFAVQVQERLRRIKWTGTLSYASLPEPYWDLGFVVDKQGATGFRPFIAALAATGLQE